MKQRTVFVLAAIVAACVLAAFALDQPIGDPKVRRGGQLLAPPTKDLPGTPIPEPIPEPPGGAIDVRVLNFPVDESGHLEICDHSGAPRRVEVINPTAMFELAGFTSATTLPDIGVFGMSRLCLEEFPGSRMCNVGEALATVDPPVIEPTLGSLAWVRDDAALGGPAGETNPQRRARTWCDGWTGTVGVGLAITVDGGIATNPCSELARVACCAPRP